MAPLRLDTDIEPSVRLAPSATVTRGISIDPTARRTPPLDRRTLTTSPAGRPAPVRRDAGTTVRTSATGKGGARAWFTTARHGTAR